MFNCIKALLIHKTLNYLTPVTSDNVSRFFLLSVISAIAALKARPDIPK